MAKQTNKPINKLRVNRGNCVKTLRMVNIEWNPASNILYKISVLFITNLLLFYTIFFSFSLQNIEDNFSPLNPAFLILLCKYLFIVFI